jgi:hypothetical protein
VALTCHPSYIGSINRRIVVPRDYSKILEAKRPSGLVQVVECLPRKHGTLSLNLNTTKNVYDVIFICRMND